MVPGARVGSLLLLQVPLSAADSWIPRLGHVLSSAAYLEQRAQDMGMCSLFLLTTRTADW